MDKHQATVLKNAKKKHKEASKLAKRGLFRWTTDHNQASSMFEKAAMMYNSCGAIDDAVKCLVEAADSNLKTNNSVMAGKNYEQAGKFLVKDKRPRDAVKYYELGSVTFYEDGKPERATELLINGAEALQKADAEYEEISELYQRALEIMGDNDKYHYGMSYFQHYNSFLCKNKKYQDCINNLLVQKKGFKHLKQDHNITKANLAIVVLCLQIGDLKKADEYNDGFIKGDKGYSRTEEYVLSESLIQCCDDRDEKQLALLRKESKLKFIDPAISRIGRKLTLENVKGRRLKEKKLIMSSDEEDGEDDSEEESDDGDDDNNR